MISDEEFRRRVDGERGIGMIRSQVGPWLLPCVWTECDRPARRENLVAIREGDKLLSYFFCTDKHKLMWLHAPQDLGQLPRGSKNMVS